MIEQKLRTYSSLETALGKLVLVLAGIYFTVFKKTYKINNMQFSIPFELTNFKFRGLFATNIYEKEERKYLQQFLQSQARVLELGGCLGIISCLTNSLLRDKKKHVVLEANINLITHINKNRQKNNCSFQVENCIISKKEDNDFYISDIIVVSSNKKKTNNKTTVKGVTIEYLEKKYDIQFDTLIMDIEGGEFEVLTENKKALSKFKKLFIEFHPFDNILTAGEVIYCEKILLSLGFSLVVRDGYFQVWEKVAV